MTEHDPNISGRVPEDLPLGARLRAVADAEIDHGAPAPEGVDRADARIAFERALRESVARTMGGAGTGAPPELRARIESMLRGAVAEPAGADGAPDGVVRSPLGDTRDRSFWSRVSGVAAVAAVLALCATVVVFSVRALQSNQGPTLGGVATLQASTLTSFIHGEHQHCAADPAYTARKIDASDLAGARAFAASHLDGVPAVLRDGFEDVRRAGFEFAGIGDCHVPGKGRSVHIVFREAGGDRGGDRVSELGGGRALVSLFVQVDERQWSLASERCAMVREGLPRGASMAAWRDDGFLYFLFTPRADHLATFRVLLDVPEKECRLSPVR